MCTNWGRGPPLRPCGIVGFRSVYQLFWQLFASVGGGRAKKTSLLPPLHLWAKPLRGVEPTRGGEQKAFFSPPFPHFLLPYVREKLSFLSSFFLAARLWHMGRWRLEQPRLAGFFGDLPHCFPFLYMGGCLGVVPSLWRSPYTAHCGWEAKNGMRYVSRPYTTPGRNKFCGPRQDQTHVGNWVQMYPDQKTSLGRKKSEALKD